MRFNTLVMGLLILVAGIGCQNTPLLECEQESEKIRSQAAELQETLESERLSSAELVTAIFDETKKSLGKAEKEHKSLHQGLDESEAKLQQSIANLSKSRQDNEQLMAQVKYLMEQLEELKAQLAEQEASAPEPALPVEEAPGL